jgi:hypothetical protein
MFSEAPLSYIQYDKILCAVPRNSLWALVNTYATYRMSPDLLSMECAQE